MGSPAPRHSHRRPSHCFARWSPLPRSWRGMEAQAPGSRIFNHKTSCAHDLDRLGTALARTAGIPGACSRALAGFDPTGRAALSPTCSRLPGITAGWAAARGGEIADRFLEQVRSAPQTTLPRETRALHEHFSPSRAIPDETAAELRAFARQAFHRPSKIAPMPPRTPPRSRAPRVFSRARRRRRPLRSHRLRSRSRILPGFVFELHEPPRTQTFRWSRARLRTGLLTRRGSAEPITAVRLRSLDRTARGLAGGYSAPFVIGRPPPRVPAENAAISLRAPGSSSSSRRARDYRGTIR